MKNNFIIFALGTFLLLFYAPIYADKLLILTFQPYPSFNEPTLEKAEKKARKMQQPGYLAKYHIKKFMADAAIRGIFSTYAGFLETSNIIGMTTFPLLHSKPFIYIIITPKITPVIMTANTIHHWEIENTNQAAIYKAEMKQDPDSGLYYWDMQEAQLPSSPIIPAESVTIIADPAYIVVPTGITVTKESPHMILPPIYIKKGIVTTNEALYTLNVRHFFGALHYLTNKQPTHYSIHLVY